ncbi:hypothetical protein [Algibacter pacificus]|uniref:hypothetical protein n=1 Tax=Algibacter pacificus TaxID=2599389 RepID=UPI0011CA0F42|nr:hypothetical protein [Algibacter pacificus]
MVEVFITNVKFEVQSIEVLQVLEIEYPKLKFNFDLEGFNKPYPCGHSILRIEGDLIDIYAIAKQLKNKGVACELLKDKVCV